MNLEEYMAKKITTNKVNKEEEIKDGEKQISVRLDNETIERLEVFFSGESRYSAARVCILESLNNIRQCIKSLKGRLKKDEIEAFIKLLKNWKMELSVMNIRNVFEQRVEDYVELTNDGDVAFILLATINKFNDYELYTILRYIKKALATNNPLETACKDFKII